MKHPLCLGLTAFFFFCFGKASATSCSVFATNSSDEETRYELFFENEAECRLKLEQLANDLLLTSPSQIGYSIEENCPFMDKVWNEFLTKMSDGTYFDNDPMADYLTTASLSTFPRMQGWDSATKDIQAQTPEAEPFFALRLTPRDKKNISILLNDLADKSYLQLLANKRSMDRKGDKVRIIHPMRFIGHILSDPHLHRCLKTIEKDSIKFKEFVAGFEKQMEEEALKKELLDYAPGLAELLQTDVDVIIDIIKNRNYSNIIKKFL